MLEADRLADALTTLPVLSYNRNVFRAVELEALQSINPMQPLFDLGPCRRGQRYTPPGGPPALYVSEDPATSYFEGTGMFAAVAALAHQNAPATVIFNIVATLENILDITTEVTQQRLQTNIIELTSSWKWQMAMGSSVPTHILANVAYATGRFQAIRFPSARRDAEPNLVIWTDKLVEPFFVEVNDHRYSQRIPPA